ncbi:hypothetical protein TNCV_3333651 [Trichonephila clavipes]|nr:hypothetical protein TNCV_3333651 [Trichonephila clavipes]
MSSNLYLVETGERRPALFVLHLSPSSDQCWSLASQSTPCAARIITGFRYSCQIDIVLFESNLPSLSKRRLYSVTRSELIAIRRGLQCAAQLEDRFQEIWILTDSQASIQHLANWGDIGDQTSLDILSLLHDFLQHIVYVFSRSFRMLA